MNGLSLINRLLNGVNVEWLTLGNVIRTVTAPSKLKSQSYCSSGKFPIIDQGAQFIAGYTDEDVTPVDDGELIVFGDHTENIKFVSFPFVQGADGVKILKPLTANCKYVYHTFLNFYAKELSYKRHWSSAQQTLIPIPCPDNPKKSIEIQAEIVRILDAFSGLTDELITELITEMTARKKQYNFYRDQLLTFEEGEVKWRMIGDIAELRRGRVMSKEYLADNAGEYPVYSSQTGNNGEIGKITSFDYDGEYVNWTTDGANAGTVFYRSGKFSITNVSGIIRITDNSALNCRFLFHWLSIEAKKHVYSGMGNPKLMSNQVERIPVPIPSLAEQMRIVSILDKFSVIFESTLECLPREMELRKKQYEYYRNQLLSFPKPN